RRPLVSAWLATLRFAWGFAPLASPPPATPMRPLLTMDVNIQEIEQDFVSKSTVEIFGSSGK
ncbi:MAG: hypothetical protein ACYC54_09890, partial [Sedimentisphaerales bacterium]